MQADNKEKTVKTEQLSAFAHRIQLLAGRLRLRQIQIAEALTTERDRVTPQRVGSWFQGKNFPGKNVEQALAALLQTSVDWLIHGKEPTDSTAGGIVQEEAAPYDVIIAEEQVVRDYLADLLKKAAGSPARLNWILEQMRTHLVAPPHWKGVLSMKEVVQRAEAQGIAEGKADAKREAAHLKRARKAAGEREALREKAHREQTG